MIASLHTIHDGRFDVILGRREEEEEGRREGGAELPVHLLEVSIFPPGTDRISDTYLFMLPFQSGGQS